MALSVVHWRFLKQTSEGNPKSIFLSSFCLLYLHHASGKLGVSYNRVGLQTFLTLGGASHYSGCGKKFKKKLLDLVEKVKQNLEVLGKNGVCKNGAFPKT